MIRVVLFWSLLIGTCNTTTAGARKDYEGCAGCETRLEGETQKHCLGDTIYYEAPSNMDPREEQVRKFFSKHKSPAAKYAKLFIQVADENDLDWRLLPSLAFIESGGGKVYRNNNIFGWNSGKKKFRTIEDGIRFVGHALTTGPYRGKTTTQKIRVYNVYKHYHMTAAKVMKWIGTTSIT